MLRIHSVASERLEQASQNEFKLNIHINNNLIKRVAKSNRKSCELSFAEQLELLTLSN
jgi:hypothetical protein